MCLCPKRLSSLKVQLSCLFLPPNMQNKLSSTKNRNILSLLKSKHHRRKRSKYFSFILVKWKEKPLKYCNTVSEVRAVSFFFPSPAWRSSRSHIGTKWWTGALLTPYLIGKEERKGHRHPLFRIYRYINLLYHNSITIYYAACTCGQCTADHTPW